MKAIPSISVNSEDKNYIDDLRRKSPASPLPTKKAMVEYILNFIKSNEDSFLEWLENKNRGGGV